jgi:adenylosuccinate lyase
METARRVKQGDGINDLTERIANDSIFGMTQAELNNILEPSNYVGRAPEQTAEFLKEQLAPVLNAHRDEANVRVDITV